MVFLLILLFSQVVLTVVVLKAEVLGVGFGDRLTFALRFGGALLLFWGGHLILYNCFALDGSSGLGNLQIVYRLCLHTLQVVIVLGLVGQVIFLSLGRTGFPSNNIRIIHFGFLFMFLGLTVLIRIQSMSLIVKMIFHWLTYCIMVQGLKVFKDIGVVSQ